MRPSIAECVRWATCGVTPRFRIALTHSRVSYPLSAPKLSGWKPLCWASSSITGTASRWLAPTRTRPSLSYTALSSYRAKEGDTT